MDDMAHDDHQTLDRFLYEHFDTCVADEPTTLTPSDAGRQSGFICLPVNFSTLDSVTVLDLSGCYQLVALPTSIGDMVQLQELDLSRCTSLYDLPASIGDLGALTVLHMDGCSVGYVPESIGNLRSLEVWTMRLCCWLTALPNTLAGLARLRTLDIHSCGQLTSLPASVGELRALETLDVRDCYGLRRLPSTVWQLWRLSIDIIDNTWLQTERGKLLVAIVGRNNIWRAHVAVELLMVAHGLRYHHRHRPRLPPELWREIHDYFVIGRPTLTAMAEYVFARLTV